MTEALKSCHASIAKGSASTAAPSEPRAGATPIGASASLNEPAREDVIKAASVTPVARAIRLPCNVE